MSDEAQPKYVWNYQKDRAFITDRTLHKLRERDGYEVTAECGAQFRAERRNGTNVIGPTDERHRCGRCFDL